MLCTWNGGGWKSQQKTGGFGAGKNTVSLRQCKYSVFGDDIKRWVFIMLNICVFWHCQWHCMAAVCIGMIWTWTHTFSWQVEVSSLNLKWLRKNVRIHILSAPCAWQTKFHIEPKRDDSWLLTFHFSSGHNHFFFFFWLSRTVMVTT